MASAARTDGAADAIPKDVLEQKKQRNADTLLFSNIPAGGSSSSTKRTAPERSAQNSSFKNFPGQRARA
jgi:hypothetical protein